MKRTILISLGLLGALALTACAATAPATTRTPTEAATPSATEPTASAEASVVPTRIIITAETVSLVADDDTTLTSFTYF